MAVISGVSIDRVGDLFDLPLGENGDIARLANGGYAVIAEVAGLGFSILRVFDAEGNAVRSLAFEGSAPAIAGLSDGRIAVTTQVDGFMTPIIVRADFRSFETLSSVSLNSGAVSAGANGTFVSANTEQFATDRDVDLTFYDSAGTVLTRVDIESDANIEARDVDVAVLTNGNAVVTRTHTDLSTGAVRLVFSVHDPLGNVVVADTEIPNAAVPGDIRHARVVATADGFAIVYEYRLFRSLELDVRMVTFNLNGVQTDDLFITNSAFFSSGLDDGFADTAPEIAIGPDGNIAITWTREDDGNLNPMLFVIGQGVEQTIGFDTLGNFQSEPLVTFFGTGQIAAYHFDNELNSLRGEHFSGFRDSFGTNGRDVFTGDDFTDLINGSAGNDKLSGARGDDTIQGGDGRDKLFGNDGDDLLQGEEGVGANGGGNHSDRMFGGAGNDTLEGENGDDTLDGGTGDDQLDGGIGNDLLLGQSQSDTLKGNIGADRLFGGNGDDTLDGGQGVDEVTGGLGSDRFLLTVATAGNRDQLTDFVSGVDKIALDFQTFSVIGNQVDETQLRFGTAAQDADDFLIYDQPTGRLFFDADANGIEQAVVIATVPAGSVLVFTDFEFA